MCQDLSSLHLARGIPHQWAGKLSILLSSQPESRSPGLAASLEEAESKLFVREPVVVPVAALAAMSHEDAVGRQVPRGPPALSMEVWFSAAQEAGIAIMDQASSSTVAVQNRNKMEMEQRMFGAINTTVVEGGSDAS